MMDYPGERDAGAKIENAVIAVLKEGKVRTPDLGGTSKTHELGDAIVLKIKELCQ